MESNPFEAELVRMFEVIEKAAEGASQIATLVEDGSLKTGLVAALKNLAEVDRDLDLDLKTIVEIQSAASQINSEGAETISEKFNEMRRNAGTTNAGRCRDKIEEIRKNIQNPPKNSRREDEDMEIMTMTYSSKDPITKQDIQDPVKNSHCGHVYDRESVKAYIAQCRCPVRSCPEKRQLDMANMVHFPEFFNMISK